MEKKALYNALRIQAEGATDWRTTDWRELSIDALFAGLKRLGIHLDRMSFARLSEEYDTPEEMAAQVAEEMKLEEEAEDELFLHLFELWRRLVPEKQTLSLFCDELDYRISRYLSGSSEDSDGLETDLATLQVMLDEKVDEGHEPLSLFQEIQEHTASDLEGFLFNYISDQIDLDNPTYATEIVDAFKDYISDIKWFALLKARLLLQSDPEEGGHLLLKLIRETEKESDIEFHLELLTLLAREGNHKEFIRKGSALLSKIQNEEELRDLLLIMHSYYHDLDHEERTKKIEALLNKDLMSAKKEIEALLS